MGRKNGFAPNLRGSVPRLLATRIVLEVGAAERCWEQDWVLVADRNLPPERVRRTVTPQVALNNSGMYGGVSASCDALLFCMFSIARHTELIEYELHCVDKIRRADRIGVSNSYNHRDVVGVYP